MGALKHENASGHCKLQQGCSGLRELDQSSSFVFVVYLTYSACKNMTKVELIIPNCSSSG